MNEVARAATNTKGEKRAGMLWGCSWRRRAHSVDTALILLFQLQDKTYWAEGIAHG